MRGKKKKKDSSKFHKIGPINLCDNPIKIEMRLRRHLPNVLACTVCLSFISGVSVLDTRLAEVIMPAIWPTPAEQSPLWTKSIFYLCFKFTLLFQLF